MLREKMPSKKLGGVKMQGRFSFPQWGDPVLSTPTQRVTPKYMRSTEFKKLTGNMFKIAENLAYGIAANQMGIPRSFITLEIHPHAMRPDIKWMPKTILVNPKIVRYSKEKGGGLWEACLSCPDALRFYTERPKWIDVEYTDGFTGKKIKEHVEGVNAIVYQHEIDHLNGRICAERVVVRNGEVVPGAIVTNEWYKARKGAPPEALRAEKK